jgi:hypothetical protein
MQRFKANDRVFILPKYAHLYPQNSGLVLGVVPDPFRPMFNEYKVEFADRSTADLFEFQVIEDLANYNTFIASIIFDSQKQATPTEIRSHSAVSRQIILQSPGFHIDMAVYKSKSLASIIGQVLQRGTKEVLKGLDVRLMKESMPVTVVTSDNLGVFKFRHVPHGSLNILVTIHQYLSRILGSFSI